MQEFLAYAPSQSRKVTNTRWHILYIEPRESLHAVWIFWDRDWNLLNWFVNLQAPVVRTPRGIQTTDYYLDLVVTPDLRWRWKDEDEFDAVCAAGIFTEAERQAIRAEGEMMGRRIEAREWPFTEEWANWRPESGWTAPQIEDHWPADLPFAFVG